MLDDGTDKTQSLSRVFSFAIFPELVKFSYLVSELALNLNHHPAIQINSDKVTLELNTWTLNNSISNFGLSFEIQLDQLYEFGIKENAQAKIYMRKKDAYMIIGSITR